MRVGTRRAIVRLAARYELSRATGGARYAGGGIALEAQVRERVQQRELVRCDEVAFGEQALQFPQKRELADRRIGHCSVLSQ